MGPSGQDLKIVDWNIKNNKQKESAIKFHSPSKHLWAMMQMKTATVHVGNSQIPSDKFVTER